EIAFARRRGSDAPPLLLSAARRLAPLDAVASRDTYLEGFEAAMYAGRFADIREIAAAAGEAPPAPDPPRAADLPLDAHVTLQTPGLAAAAPVLRRALSALCDERETRWLGLGSRSAAELLDVESWQFLAQRHYRIAVEAGALSALAPALTFLAVEDCMHSG